jgi:S1-C subfamily serine protease
LADSPSLPDAIDRVRPGVVQITHTISGIGWEGVRELGGHGAVFSAPIGTGFIASPDGLHVVTAGHVLDNIRNLETAAPDGEHRVGAGLAYPNTEQMRGTFRVIPYDLVSRHIRHDLALLRLRQHPAEQAGIVRPDLGQGPIPVPFGHAEFATERPRDGDPVAVSGYPLAQPVMITNAGTLASAWAVDIDKPPEREGPPKFEGRDIADAYLLDTTVNNGNSGGPAYRAGDGRVIGVCVSSLLGRGEEKDAPAYNAGIARIVPSKYVLEMLADEGVTFATSP